MSSDRTDYNTLISVLEKHQEAFDGILEEVTADSGYCSEKNLLYPSEQIIASYIKPQGYEKRMTRAYAADISKYYNMTLMKINERWDRLQEESHANIQSEKGLLKRQIRFLHNENKKYEGKTGQKIV